MELFLSYSRRDSAIGDQLRADLEAAGHHVWLDRDDIRGGDQWRASIANGIAAADRVLLLMSPSSMESENVAREISIAQDQDKPILPIVLKTSEIPAEFQFLLAGVQTISFEGRPYRSALDGLLEDLTAPPSTSGQEASTSHPTQRSRSRPRWLKMAGFVTAVAAVAVIGLNQDFDQPSTSDQDFDQPSASVIPADVSPDSAVPTTVAGARTFDLEGSGWLAGVEFSPSKAVHDPISGVVSVDYLVDVTQTEIRSWVELYPSLWLRLEDGSLARSSDDSGDVPGLGISNVTIHYCCVPAEADLGAASLMFGQQTEQQWTVPMRADGRGTGTMPIHLDSAERVDAEGFYFETTNIDLVPWSCYVSSDGRTARRGMTIFAPVSSDRLTVLLTGTLGSVSTQPGEITVGQVSLTQPNGHQSLLVGSYWLYQTNDFATQVPLCFLVATPGTGNYRLNWASSIGGQDTFDFTIG